MAEYAPVVVPFDHSGVVQTVARERLKPGQYHALENITLVQAGNIQSRFGSERKTAAIGSLIHTIEGFRLGSADTEKYLYVGEGSDIYRIKVSDFATVTDMGASLESWGQRFTATKLNVGRASRPHVFIASSSMLKDSAVTPGGTATTSFTKWGMIPPPGALSASVGSQLSKTVTTTPTTITWHTAGSDSNKFMGDSNTENTPITILNGTVNLSEFNSTTKSGKASDGYDSDDFIELVFTPDNPSRFEYWILQFDVSASANDYNDYYEKYIVPNQMSGVLNRTENPLTSYTERADLLGSGAVGLGGEQITSVEQDGSSSAQLTNPDNVAEGSKPIELPPSRIEDGGTPPAITVKIRKNEFLKVGAAGTSGKTWADVKHVRLWARSGTLGASDLDLVVSSVKLIGGAGPSNIDPGLGPYEWAYTYRNDATGDESNPCPFMVEDRYIKNIQRQPVELSGFLASSDGQVTSIGVYRRGGTLLSWKLVGYKANDTSNFTDNLSDVDLKDAPTMESDNDPPVTSSLPTAFKASATGPTGTGSQSISVTVAQPSGLEADDVLTVGTRLLVQEQDKTEYVQVTAVTGNTISVIFQQNHSSFTLYTASVVGVPCRLSTVVGSHIILAGDRNNPHVAYMSKAGRPQSFPVVVESTGNVNQVNIGTPSNPIMALTEYGGDLVSLNRHGLFTVGIFNGQLQKAQETPAQNGLCVESGWVKAENHIVYLADDGVYAWAGGAEQNISGDLDWFFRGKTVAGRAPMSRTAVDLGYVKMAYYQNQVWLTCRDTSGDSWLLVYDSGRGIRPPRWEFYKPSAENALAASWSTLYNLDGVLYSARVFSGQSTTDAYIYKEQTGYEDNTYSIPIVVETGYFDGGMPSVNKQWGDIVLEFTSVADLTVKVYYDFAASPSETFSLTGAAGRRRIPLPLNSGNAVEAYSIAFRFEGQSSDSSHVILHSLTFNVLNIAEVQRGRAGDWTDGGYPYDKRLDQLVIDYDTNGQNVTLNLDTITGVAGATITSAVATFTLNGQRSQAALPIKKASDNDWVVCKKWRLRPTTTSTDFHILSANVTYEKQPPDVTLFTDQSDYGSPFDKYFNQLILDIDTGGVAATVDVYIDNAGSPSQSFSVTTTEKSRQTNLTMKTGLSGKKAHLRITPGGGGKAKLWSHDFVTTPVDKGAVLHTFDWDDLGHPYDKRLYELIVEYEVASDTTLNVECVYGVAPTRSTTTLTFTLKGGVGRMKHSFPISNATPFKLVRVYPAANTPATTAKIYKYDFQFEKLPPDIVYFTEPSDYGSPFEKNFNQLILDVDTGGVAATVTVELDGVSFGTTFSVTTNSLSRRANVTLPVGMKAKKARILATPGGGGKFQLFSHDFVTTPVDPGPVLHTFDWDDLGTPYDKLLKTITIPYEVTTNTVVQIEYQYGIPPNFAQGTPVQVTLEAPEGAEPARREHTFNFADNTIAKMIRVSPLTAGTPNTAAKIYRYTVDKAVLPPDTMPYTDWSDLGYKCEKILRSMTIDIDTGNVQATIQVYVDGTLRSTFYATTTRQDRVRTFSFVSDIANTVVIGKLIKLVITAGSGGKSQVYDVQWDYQKEPCPLIAWDSFEQYFGSNGYKYIKQVWFEYRCAGQVTMKFYRDGGTLFYTKTLPVQAQRDVQRFYLPEINSGVLNKSHGYRVTVESVDPTKPFYFYRDTSRIETMLLSGDARQPFNQHFLWVEMPLQR